MKGIADQVKAIIAATGNAPLSMKELQAVAVAGMRNTMRQMALWGQGTPARTPGNRKRFVLADGRVVHPTKGIGKSHRGGYARRSRRSNRS